MRAVLLVGDHAAFARAFELVLEREGDIEVVLACTHAEGKKLALDGNPFALVLVDLVLSDGAELAAEIRRSQPGTPVAIMGDGAGLETARAAEVGATTINRETPLADLLLRLGELLASEAV